MGLLSVILVSLIFGVLCYYLAGRKGYNKQFWFIMGVLFGPFAVPFVFLRSKKDYHGEETDI
jgi:hypothetical protein